MAEAAVKAVEALSAALAAGIEITLDDKGLLLEANAEPPQLILDELTRHKPDILALLRPVQGGWTAGDWQAFFDERAGIAECDQGLPREQAEVQAFMHCLVEWLNRNPAQSIPGRCAMCSRPETPNAVVVPFGTEPGEHAWLHAECWPAWHGARRAAAIAALGAMGVRHRDQLLR
jgi:hypothetical protein